MVGDAVGELVGSAVVGEIDGEVVGDTEGEAVGSEVVGEIDGEVVGDTEGEAVGSEVVGPTVGSPVAIVGATKSTDNSRIIIFLVFFAWCGNCPPGGGGGGGGLSVFVGEIDVFLRMACVAQLVCYSTGIDPLRRWGAVR